MESVFLNFIQSHPVINIFLVIGTGGVVGKIEIGNIDIGSVTGVHLVGLIAGHFKFTVPTAAK